jgi:predicted signal transduction protein with EAL and GGDEF domain
MQETVGRDGVVGHFGGDLFTIVSSRLHDEEATTRLADALVAAVARPMRLSRGEVSVNASVGISVSQGRDDTSETLLRNANIALHEAKERANGQTVVFDSGRHDRDVQHLHTRGDLQRALDRQEFLLYYQPVVSLETGRAASFEALVRWQHPERGLLLPHEFITHAEHSGVIGRLGAWVLEEACRTTMLSSAPELAERWNLSVNLSPRQLADPSFPTTVAEILGRTAMDPDRLSLEITETTLMLDAPWATGALEALRDLGIHIAVDDFGTGYSCLAYLRSLPVDTLKIDRYFVEGIGSDPASTAICAAIVGLADALDLETIAEGVETPQQLSQLRDLGCRLGQGHLFGHALPAEHWDDMRSIRAAASR